MPDTPNIIVLLPDQLRHDFLSCYGASFIDTPNIDWIAEQGVRYDRAYSASPVCVPARTAMLTGMSALRNGVTSNLHAIRPDHNAAGICTWPQLMAGQGYYTAAVGKTHYYPWNALHGFQYRVFCEDKLWPQIRDDYYHYLRQRGLKKLDWDEYGGYVQNKCAATTNIPWEHGCDRFTGREARRFIDTYGPNGPFVLFVGFPGPHDPYDPADDFPHKYLPKDMPKPIAPSTSHGDTLRQVSVDARAKMGMDFTTYTESEMRNVRAHYAGLVKQIDHEVGEIVDTLRRNDLLDHTVIIFTSDHGDHLGDHGIEGKGTFYEAASHIPLLVCGPGAPEGAVCQDLVELRDTTATILHYGGCDLPDHMDAQSLPGLELSDAAPRQRIFGALVRSWMNFDGRWKLCKYRGGEAMLFDLKNDPQEQRNLIDDPKHMEVVRLLDAELTDQVMGDILFAMHDRRASFNSLALDAEFGHQGWNWSYPSPASFATGHQDPY